MNIQGGSRIACSMSPIKKTFSVILLLAMLLLLVFLPKYASSMLGGGSAADWLKPKEEAFGGVLHFWHVVRFKPHSGSMGAWLDKYARRIEKRHFGVYLQVESMLESEAKDRLNAGERPDIISFPAGSIDESMFDPISEGSDNALQGENAVALAASCELLLTRFGEADGTELSALIERAQSNSESEFRAGKADCCIADARFCAEMQRLVSAGKAELFDCIPFKKETELVQFIGIVNGTEKEKHPYLIELIELLSSEKAQKELVDMGLLPMNGEVEPDYEQSYLADAYRLIINNNGVRQEAFD